MGTLQFTDLQNRPTEVLDWTSLTIEAFQPLVPPFETAFQAYMAHWRLDGRRRAMVLPPPGPPTPANPPAPAPASPLLGMMGPNGASDVPRIRLSRRAMIAARKSATR